MSVDQKLKSPSCGYRKIRLFEKKIKLLWVGRIDHVTGNEEQAPGDKMLIEFPASSLTNPLRFKREFLLFFWLLGTNRFLFSLAAVMQSAQCLVHFGGRRDSIGARRRSERRQWNRRRFQRKQNSIGRQMAVPSLSLFVK